MFNISISGKANSGKNTVAELLVKELLPYSNKKHKILAFADPMKEIAKTMFPDIPYKHLYGPSKYRESIIPKAFKNGVPLTVRQLIIDIGASARQYNPDIWINKLNDTYLSIKKKTDIIIVSDTRFRSELNYLESENFFNIRILRNCSLIIDDVSETMQDEIEDYEFRYIIDNSGSLKKLKKEVKKMARIIVD